MIKSRFFTLLSLAILALSLAGCRTYRTDAPLLGKGDKISLAAKYTCSWGTPDDDSDFEVRHSSSNSQDNSYSLSDGGSFNLGNNKITFKRLSDQLLIAQLQYQTHKPRYYFVRSDAQGNIAIGGLNKERDAEIKTLAGKHSIKLTISDQFFGQDVWASGSAHDTHAFLREHTAPLIEFKYACRPTR